MGQNGINLKGRELVHLIHQNTVTHLGPDFDTFVSARGKGRPDIIIGNKNAHLNFAIQQGPLTTSDHIPIIFKLSTSPIMIPQRETYNYKRADWNMFQNEIMQQMTVQANANNENEIINQEVVDRELDMWYNTVENAMEKAIPKKNYLTLPHPKTSDKLKLLQWRYKNILDIVEYLGWTPLLCNQYRELQLELKDESKILYENQWNKVIRETELEYNNPKKFWSNIKRLSGSNQESSPYLLNEENTKIFASEEKEKVFRKFWENIFKISPVTTKNSTNNMKKW